MRKQEAIEMMKRGIKITHFLFSDEEFMTMNNGKVVTEEDYGHNAMEFWKYRQGANWEHGYEVFFGEHLTVSYLCRVIEFFTGGIVSKEDAKITYKQNLAGDGANTIGFDYLRRVYPEKSEKFSHEAHTGLGDALVYLGKLLTDDNNKENQTFRVGDRFEIDREEYILGSVGSDTVVLINLETGNRWDDTFEVDDPAEISFREMHEHISTIDTPRGVEEVEKLIHEISKWRKL